MITNSEKLLIVAPAWIGDMVMAHSLIKLLKARNPKIVIDVLAPPWTYPLAERMPEVRSAILFPLGHGQLQVLVRYKLAKRLKEGGYNQAIVLPCSFKSALTPLWAGIPKRTGWLGEWRFGLLNDLRRNKEDYPLMIQQFMALGLSASEHLPSDLTDYYPQISVNENNRETLIMRLELSTDRPIIALCPGAEYGPAKRWPPEYFARVAQQMAKKGWQVWIFGSPKDSSYAKDICSIASDSVDLTGKTSLLDAIDLMSLAEAVISNDSGLMHIAAALRRPLVVLYGSSTPAFTPPLTKQVEIVHLDLPCSPCFKRTCPLGHFDCMNRITPDLVLSKLHSLAAYA